MARVITEKEFEQLKEVKQLRAELTQARTELARLRHWLAIQKQGRDGDRNKLLERMTTLDAAENELRAERQLRREAEQRTEELERERDEWRGDWESTTAKLLNAEALGTKPTRPKVLPTESSIQPSPRQSQQRAERTEALAALVNEETAALLERLAEAEQIRDHWHSLMKHERAWRCEAQKETTMQGIAYRTKLDETTARLARAKQRLARRDTEYEAARKAALALEKRLAESEQYLHHWHSIVKHEYADAEALAALVTLELADLLDGMIALAESTDVQVPTLLQGPMLRMINDAHAITAEIREALGEH